MMASSFILPYFADEASLPAPLPTTAEIESATDILHERLSSASGRVVGIGEHFVVKYGALVNLQEGQTMLFLQHSSTVPVPRVYALYQQPGPDNNTHSYIVMERIRGPTLASVWPKIGQTEKEAIALKLCRIFKEMRRLETPGGYCSFGRRGLTDSLFDAGDDSTTFKKGPFDTESDLNEAMLAIHAREGSSQHKTQHFSRAFKDVFRNHAPVFTHADFQRKNVMLRNPPPTITKNSLTTRAAPTEVDLVIIDWEFAGWYPSYWEYARALFGCGAWEDDWSEWIERFLEPYRNEYAWLFAFWCPYI